MGILDDAIREHLDLKRKHGARDAELREIQDDAFGSGERPDPFAAGDLFGETSAPTQGERGSEESPGPPTPAPSGLGDEEPTRLLEPRASAPPAPSATPPPEPATPPPEPASTPPKPQPPAPAPPPDSESLADLMADEEELDPPRAEASSAEAERVIEEEPVIDEKPLYEEEPEPEPSGEPLEPRDSVPEPPPPPPEPGTEPPGRARGRVHHPTEELPPPPEPPSEQVPLGPPLEQPSSAEQALPPETGEEDAAQLYDFETDEGPVDEPPVASAPDDAFEDLGPAEEQPRYVEDQEDEPKDERSSDDTGEDDLLSGSPEFLDQEGSDTDEEDLWFEKGPPKDFDFEDEK